MQAHVLQRIDELISRGNATVRAQSREDYWIEDIVQAQSWMASAANAIQQVAPAGSFFRTELDRLMSNDQLKGGIPISVAEKVLGVLQSVQVEAKAGLLTKLEDQVVATAHVCGQSGLALRRQIRGATFELAKRALLQRKIASLQ